MEFDFSGKTALITGASMGIGRATAIDFAKHNAKVVLLDIDEEGLKKVAAEIEALGADVSIYPCDISSEALVNAAYGAALEKYGAIDIAVNNAGLWNTHGEFAQSSSSDWKRKIDVNILGTLYITRAVIGGMIERRYGRIVNIGSVAGVYGIATMADYSMTKGAIIGFTKALAKEVTPHGVTVNCVSPGTVSDSAAANDKCYASRFGRYQENADLILFIASEYAGYISGQNYIIDGCRRML